MPPDFQKIFFEDGFQVSLVYCSSKNLEPE